MPAECPGRRGARDLDSVLVRCPACGAQVEMFSDEAKARCRCGEVILREAIPTCATWCPSADVCLGDVIDLRTVRQRIREAHGPDADRLVREMGERIAQASAQRDDGTPPKPSREES